MSASDSNVLPDELQQEFQAGKELMKASNYEAASEAFGALLTKAYVTVARVHAVHRVSTATGRPFLLLTSCWAVWVAVVQHRPNG